MARDLAPARAAAGLAARIELAVVTRHGAVPADLLADPPLVVTGTAGARRAADDVGPERVLVVPGAADPATPDLRAALDALADRGLRHVLAEGGPSLLADLLAADLVDELCLTTSPLLVGGGAPRVTAGGAHLPAPRPARVRHLLAAPDGTLLTCWDLRPAVRSDP